MASSYASTAIFLTLALLIVHMEAKAIDEMSPSFYATSCPKLFPTVKPIVESAIKKEARMGASLLRLFYHDCFVNGCDASLLLDDAPNFIGEKNIPPNKNSTRGYEVIDEIKSAVEKMCPGIVSCADIIAIVARDSVSILGGPSWGVQLGRRDARATNAIVTNVSIPLPKANLKELVLRFRGIALKRRDLVALVGAHTLGEAQCHSFRERIYNERNMNKELAQKRRLKCPRSKGSGDANLAPIDAQTPIVFDNSYYKNLVQNKGLLHSDQQLFSGGKTDPIVRTYSEDQEAFFNDFASAMIKMGSVNPLIGPAGEIRDAYMFLLGAFQGV
ncbi:unnamed protein product [Prunus armeniaca]|uniref:Peroxidase n=1 Tax=Prunus armeniaca TaxID=36596 RepID=A0A6J5U3Q9_PRUAR|nr:unnamed protein product [Prunus armeniaca]